MTGQLITVDDLIQEVRSLLDEDNRISVTTEDDILPALNRGQNFAANILVRHYDSPLIKHTSITPVSGIEEYTLPEDALEQRITQVEIKVNQSFYELTRIDYGDVSFYETPSQVAIPDYYAVVENRIRIVPQANLTNNLRIWYAVEPPKLVAGQGRINVVNTTDNYVIVDSVGSDLTTEADQLNSYVNIVDAQTGRRKASYQIKSIQGNRINFKTIPARTTVLNTTIDTSISSLNINSDTTRQSVSIEPDDYICSIKGSAVPFLKHPFSNYVVQYAIAEIRRKLGGPADLEQRVLKELEQQVERSWVNRESDMRVKRINHNWLFATRRYYGNRS